MTIKGNGVQARGIYWNYGGSKIYDNYNLRFETDDVMTWKTGSVEMLMLNQYGLNIERGGLYLWTEGDVNFRWRMYTELDGGFNQGLGNLNFMTLMPDGYFIAGFIEDDVNFTIKMNFTGSHRCVHEAHAVTLEEAVGLIVCASGRYASLLGTTPKATQKENITISESVPTVELCRKRKDKRVFGVVAGAERVDFKEGKRRHVFKSGSFGSCLDHDGVDRVEINSLGEGAVWVCDRGGNFENGDYITTSDLAGYGERQEESFVCGWTLGKFTCDVDWSDKHLDKSFQVRTIDGARCAFVGCVYLL
jgi:hypothetical protein